MNLGLPLEDVQTGREDRAGAQRGRECRLIDRRPPGGVDQDRRRLHERKPIGVDEVAGLVGERRVQAHEVRLPKPLLERDAAGIQRRTLELRVPGAGVVEDRHAPARGPAGHRVTDSTRPHDQERLADDALPGQVQRLDAGPCSAGGDGQPLAGAAGGAQKQQPGRIGRGLRDRVGCVADDDAPPAGLRDVDVVHSHRVVAHDHELAPGRVEELPVDEHIGGGGHHCLGAAGRSQKLAAIEALVARVDPDVGVAGPGQRRHRVAGQGPGDHDAPGARRLGGLKVWRLRLITHR